jgi:hypothetical protein
MKESHELLRVWNQKRYPVIFRRRRGKLLVRLPYANDNMAWLKEFGRTKPEWDKKYKCWLLPRGWLDSLVFSMLHRYQGVYLIQPYNKLEKCAPACWNAQGFDCECSCGGVNHGAGQPGGNWLTISDALAVKHNDIEYAYRLLQCKTSSHIHHAPNSHQEHNHRNPR